MSQLTINTNDDDDDDNSSSDPIPRLLVSLLITSSIGPRLGSTSAVVFMAPVGSLNCGRPGWHHCAVAAAATATCRPVLSVSQPWSGGPPLKLFFLCEMPNRIISDCMRFTMFFPSVYYIITLLSPTQRYLRGYVYFCALYSL